MTGAEFLNCFSTGIWNIEALKGKRFDVEILAGFVDLGFNGLWLKRFDKIRAAGRNYLNGVAFGEFKVEQGTWEGYTCVVLNYGVGFVSIKDYMRQTGPTTWIGVYVVAGNLKGWFRLREVKQDKSCSL